MYRNKVLEVGGELYIYCNNIEVILKIIKICNFSAFRLITQRNRNMGVGSPSPPGVSYMVQIL